MRTVCLHGPIAAGGFTKRRNEEGVVMSREQTFLDKAHALDKLWRRLQFAILTRKANVW